MWNKKRFSAIEKRLKQLECPHENIYVGDHYGLPYAACRDCGKVLQWFDSTSEGEEYRKKLKVDKHEKQEEEYEKSTAEIDSCIKRLKRSGN